MLRKISAGGETLGVVGSVCITSKEVAPSDPPPEALETTAFGGSPRPPVVVIGAEDAFVSRVTYNTPPVCPIPVRKSWFNPLTQQVEYYYDYGRGTTVIPPECGGGIIF